MRPYLMSEIIELLNQDMCESRGYKAHYKNKDEYESEMRSLENEAESLLSAIRYYLDPESDEEV